MTRRNEYSDKEAIAVEERRRVEFVKKVSEEPFARLMDIRLVEVGEGYALCEMTYTDGMDNIHGSAHGGAVFSLIDEAFEISSNSHGTVAVALSMTVTYTKPAAKSSVLRARSTEVSRGNRTATYQIVVEDNEGVIAVCQALAYRKTDRLSFLSERS
jgi:acyl-CoA thioesterase